MGLLGANNFLTAILTAVASIVAYYYVSNQVPNDVNKIPTTPPNNATLAWLAGLPLNYETLTAVEKSNLLWNKISTTQYKKDAPLPQYPGLSGLWKLAGTVLFNMAPVFTGNSYISDVMATGRVRHVHNYGSCARVVLEIAPDVEKNTFTGMLKRGANTVGLIRLGLTLNPANFGFHPGMGLKLLIDGKPSQNIQAEHNVDGQEENHDFFHRFLRTSIPDATSVPTKILFLASNMLESNAQSLTMRYIAQVDNAQSSPSIVAQPVYPWMLKFVPDARLKGLISTDSKNDFRKDLARVSAPGPLYHVYAASSLEDPNAFKIGTIQLKSDILASHFCDERLTFRQARKDPKLDAFNMKTNY